MIITLTLTLTLTLLLHKWSLSEIEPSTQTIAIIIDILFKSNYEFHKF